MDVAFLLFYFMAFHLCVYLIFLTHYKVGISLLSRQEKSQCYVCTTSRQRGTHMLTLKKHQREGILVISQKVKNVPDSQILSCVVTGLDLPSLQAVRKWKWFLFWFDVQAFLQKPQFITICIFLLLVHQIDSMAENEKLFSCFALLLHLQF